jgi:predicted amidophosphoribosyltransferase
VKGRTVIFIDDIYNTGGSYAEIVSLLENSGAKDAYGIYIARVVRS